MSAYATAISDFSTVNQNDIDSSINTAKALKGFADTLDQTGGWVQVIAGQKSLSEFATGCADIGTALASFASNIGSVSVDKTEQATTTMEIIKEFTSGLDSTGGIFNDIGKFFGGEQDVVGLSQKMATVGTNLAVFAEQISAADFSKTDQVTKTMSDMQAFVSGLETTGGLWTNIGAIFNGKQDIVGLSQNMATFANNFSTFADGITGASQAVEDFSSVQTVVTAFSALADSVKSENVDTGKLESAAETTGTTFIIAMSTAISNGSSQVSEAAKTVANSGSSAAQMTYLVWYKTGRNLGKGLANGISSMAGSVRRAAINAAAGATRAIQITWSVHSPSRVGRDLGMNFDLGIAGGLDRYSKVVSQSAEGIGERAVVSAETMLRGTDYSIFDFIDPNPTIRPVLDLSNVRSGAGGIAAMLNSDQIVNDNMFRGLNFNRGVNRLDFDGAKIAGGLSDRNVVDRLDALAEQMAELGTAVTNMKIVLDTGILVGETSSKMDNQLGELAMRRGRGN